MAARAAEKKPLILSISRDPMLLASRNALLHEAGYEVVSTTSDEEALSLFSSCKTDAVVLGDSIAWEERTKLVERIRTLNAKVPIIVLRLPTEPAPAGATASMGSLDGPKVLLQLIAEALRNSNTQAA